MLIFEHKIEMPAKMGKLRKRRGAVNLNWFHQAAIQGCNFLYLVFMADVAGDAAALLSLFRRFRPLFR